MNLPFELLYGVDVAVKKLRPGASFSISGSTITRYQDPQGRPQPTWDEVLEQLAKDKDAADRWLEQNQ